MFDEPVDVLVRWAVITLAEETKQADVPFQEWSLYLSRNILHSFRNENTPNISSNQPGENHSPRRRVD